MRNKNTYNCEWLLVRDIPHKKIKKTVKNDAKNVKRQNEFKKNPKHSYISGKLGFLLSNGQGKGCLK